MAQHAVITFNRLDEGLILIPERYDPRRYANNHVGTNISDIVTIINDQIKLKKDSDNSFYMVLDTSDANEVLIRTTKNPVKIHDIKSAKKIIHAGDVIISRLRPYLRQVAYVDPLLFESFSMPIKVVCSTEYYVLRSNNEKSIAFLAPFLLSDIPQQIFNLSQEGGHHPRFNQDTLEKIRIPAEIICQRDILSKKVEAATKKARESIIQIDSLMEECSVVEQ